MIDARGLSCPMPVILVQNEVKKNAPTEIEVLVDNRVAVENISRFAALQRYAVQVQAREGEYSLILKKNS